MVNVAALNVLPQLGKASWSAPEAMAYEVAQEGVRQAIGFYANNVINVNGQPGLLANYSGVFRHRASRSCTGADPACS